MLQSTRDRLRALELRCDGQASFALDLRTDLDIVRNRVTRIEEGQEALDEVYVGCNDDDICIDDVSTEDYLEEIEDLRAAVTLLKKDNEELRSALTGTAPRPTWVNKRGECMFVADIPTAYLVNIKNFLAKGKPGGILSVVIDELRSREQSGGH